MSDYYQIIIVLRGGQYMNITARNQEELGTTTGMINDMINRIFNAKEKNDSAPFLNLKPLEVGGMAWVDAREMSGYYVIPPKKENDIELEFKKKSLDIQERFIKVMEKEANKGDEWKKKEE